MFDNAITKILENTFTKQDFYARLGVVKECLEHVFFTEGGGDTGRTFLCSEFARQTGREEMAPFIEEWGGEVLDLFVVDRFYEQVEGLKSRAEELPTLVLYAPVILENKEVEDIGAWSRREFDPRVMIDLMVDPRSLGGCAFVWQGKYHDFSLNYFMDKKNDEIEALIRSYDAK